VTHPFGPDIEPSGDAQTVARLFTGARRFLAIGQASIANSLLGQARFLIENSPEIQLQKELDKPISDDLASELGVPIGTTLRTVAGQLPRSPEEKAEESAAASARGRGRVAGEEQLSFVTEASGIIGILLAEVIKDEGIVGIRGTLRRIGQTGQEVLSDLGLDGLLNTARQLAFEQSDASLDEIEGWFDSPTLSALKTIENSVGLILARIRQPEGRLQVALIELSIEDVKLTGLTGSKQVVNRLNFILGILDRRAQTIRGRFNLEEDVSPEGNIPEFVIEGGDLRPAN
ncbi:hypothetical protein LCGC14_2917110, partial [marine sediment metagenome]